MTAAFQSVDLEDNMAAAAVQLTESNLKETDARFRQIAVAGELYAPRDDGAREPITSAAASLVGSLPARPGVASIIAPDRLNADFERARQ